MTEVTLSYGQQRLWTLDRLEGPSATYNVPVALRLRGALDPSALGEALALVVARHEALRTVMIEDDGGLPVGRLLEPPPAAHVLEVVDLGGLDLAAREARVRELVTAEAARPFRLDADPSLRARLLRLEPALHVLALTLHHQACDADSMAIVARELSQAYAALCRGDVPGWAPLPVQYSDWAAWQQDVLEADAAALQAKVARARTRLAGFPELLALPLDGPRLTERARPEATVAFALPDTVAQRLDALARAHRTTLFTVLLAGWAATLSRLAGQSRVTVGSPVSGRTRVETAGLVGYLLNTLVLPVATDDDDGPCTGAVLIGRAHRAVQDALADQDLPFERLVEELEVPRTLAHAPVFQTMFAFRTQGEGGFALDGLDCEQVPSAPPRAKFDLTLSMVRSAEGRLGGELEYDADLFAASRVEGWVRALACTLEGLARTPDVPLGTLPLVPDADRAALIGRSVDRDAQQPARTFADLFEAQVARTPDATALVHGSQRLSYRELDAAANRLAHALLARGVGPDDVAALLVDRTPALIVAWIAVAKSGAACLPLDIGYPRPRLEYMIRDSRAAIAIADGARAGWIAGLAGEGADGPQVLGLDDEALARELGTLPDRAPTDADRRRALSPDDLLYVMYTSGSTGRPKGVGFLHGSMTNLFAWQDQRLPRPPTNVLQYSPIGFDASAHGDPLGAVPWRRAAPGRRCDPARQPRAAARHRAAADRPPVPALRRAERARRGA